MQDSVTELRRMIETHPVINTHSHHLTDGAFAAPDLNALLRQSYAAWCGVPAGDTAESRARYLSAVRHNSYFVWLQRGIQALCGSSEPISPENWDRYSEKIAEIHRSPDAHLDILKTACRYHRVILDAYRNPGSDNGHPELFSPTFRINMFLFGYNSADRDHNGNNPCAVYGRTFCDIDEYIAFIRDRIVEKKRQGCVAVKNALAYDRDLYFAETSRDRAQKALQAGDSLRTAEDVRAFQDYVFYQICRIAAELSLPVQCHTGLGQLKGTRAMALHEVITKNPDTRFVLFHCGYPWMEDVCGLLHNCRNVYPDLCWLPLISTSAAVRMLRELLEVGTSDKICWGCDTWTSEESYGALLAFRHVLGRVLEELTEQGFCGLGEAKQIAGRLLYDNAAALYGL